ncbi:MAG: hypothetical protein EXS51_03930 [Candidatus Taylorbacteria bacterium]|nr:hypothetical protein [Candidatus Taylorbacteria bacterium]
MNEEEIKQKLALLEQKIDAVYVSAEKTRKYFLAVIIVSVVTFVLPLIGLAFAIPSFLKTLNSFGGF